MRDLAVLIDAIVPTIPAIPRHDEVVATVKTTLARNSREPSPVLVRETALPIISACIGLLQRFAECVTTKGITQLVANEIEILSLDQSIVQFPVHSVIIRLAECEQVLRQADLENIIEHIVRQHPASLKPQCNECNLDEWQRILPILNEQGILPPAWLPSDPYALQYIEATISARPTKT